ncbi:MFS transporter [Candidatus Saccharibacteria bacterium]|nr:MFS transporter [Candidatus Saccharibacteria bacterium]
MKKLKVLSTDSDKLYLFDFLTMFAKSFIEIFAPLLLYKLGFSVPMILIYFLIRSSTCLIMTPLMTRLSRHIGFKKVLMITPPIFFIAYLMMVLTPINFVSLALFGVLYGIYTIAYWTPRHYFILNSSRKNEMTTRSKWFTILETVAGMIATFAGALVIDNYGMVAGIIFAGVVLALGCLPMLFMHVKTEHYRRDKFSSILRRIPKSSLAVLYLGEFKSVANTLFPLYLFIFVSQHLQFIAGFEVMIGLASILVIYVYGWLMDKKTT